MTIGRVGLLVSTNHLREKLASVWRQNRLGKDLRVLDSSYDFDDDKTDGYKDFYKQGHIPSSVYFNPQNCSKSTALIPFDLPDPHCFTDYIQSLGVSPDTHVVLYDRLNSDAALRAWWLLRLYGHRNTSVLDGGLRKWVRDGYPVTTEEPAVERGDFKSRLDNSLMKNYHHMKDSVNSQKEEIIDARGPGAFNKVIQTGKGEIKNFIPGAKNIPYRSLFNEDGTFKAVDEIKELFNKQNVDLSRPLIAMCYRGITGCALSAAAELLGKHDTPLYYGSWKEWSGRMAE
ncbi:thiosulfate sulfurtransferase-like isoform X1 [Mytilus californianus]|uniref:thiosulfate sulfurtransferase-like isoform X1 n=1 Tax=Mytilus californianus TaxID=6549 RepID=UPI00224635B1|nr:thiosulfate sulfurtransferase-like isoform X1 [Mytilus californianus]XP_052106606.1 thiosulfate sulfurtransferase-like isoform X1 [Mytilus californianus]